MPNESEIREQRHRAILSILRRSPIRRQEELVARLAERGFDVTQSSVSRDLRDLAVAKVAGRYRAPAAPAGASDAVDDIAHSLVAVRAAGPHLVVVSTQTGAAQAVGLGIDRAGWTEVVGTIAGDDTVFVATAGPRDQSRLLHRLHALLAQATVGHVAPGAR
ncbi:MAG: hypothetical protein NDJ75_01740 [Thermoanaerobaculia bacterium]|nr:hypothetical protein [Thermoanaerobaculia bacterium]